MVSRSLRERKSDEEDDFDCCWRGAPRTCRMHAESRRQSHRRRSGRRRCRLWHRRRGDRAAARHRLRARRHHRRRCGRDSRFGVDHTAAGGVDHATAAAVCFALSAGATAAAICLALSAGATVDRMMTTTGWREARHGGPQLAAARCPRASVPPLVPAILPNTEPEFRPVPCCRAGQCRGSEPTAVCFPPGSLSAPTRRRKSSGLLLIGEASSGGH